MKNNKRSQVRPIMKILNQVRELIIDAHNAGELKGRKQVVRWVHNNRCDLEPTTTYMHIDPIEWQAKLEEWGIEKEAEN